MGKHKRTDTDWLSALTVMGRILILVPVVVGLIVFVSSFFREHEIAMESSIEGPSTVFIEENIAVGTLTSGAPMIFLCGVGILVYVAVKRFQQGLRGEGEVRPGREREIRE